MADETEKQGQHDPETEKTVDGDGSEPEFSLSESFELALDQLKRSTDIEQKIEIIIPEALQKIGADDQQERAEGTAILMTLADANHENVKLELARKLHDWAMISPVDAAAGAMIMIESDSRIVNIALAEGLTKWIDQNPKAAEEVAEKLAEYKGMGVNLALADNLPDWSENHPETSGKIAKKLAKEYNHLNAVTNLLEITYGKDWLNNIDLVTDRKSDEKGGKTSKISELFLTAGEHVEKIKVSIASGLATWAYQNPDDAEEVVQSLVEKNKLDENNSVSKDVSNALLESLSQLAEEHPKTTSKLAAIMIKNPNTDVIDGIINVLKENLNVDPNPAYDAVKDIDDYYGKEKLRHLSQHHDCEGEQSLLDDLNM